MKKFFSVILLSFFTILVWSQKDESKKTIEVNYVKGYKNHKDTTNSAPKIMKDLEYQLLCNTNEARFEFISGMLIDDVKTNERFIGKGGGRGIYYKNLKEKKNIRAINKYETDLIISEELNKYNWKLVKETKNILGYDCFKAIGTYTEYSYFFNKEQTFTVTAWYAPSLPLPFGPASYDGLPGLVLEASRSSFYFIATDIKFKNKSSKNLEPTKGKNVTLDEYNKFLNEKRLKYVNQN